MQIFAGLILLAVLIVVHELGHFIVAKLMGVRVLAFSVGFGPRIFGFKKGETDYRLSAIPLGGYVSMYGEQFTEEIPEEEKKFSFLHQPVWKKSLIAVAGPLFNFILPVVLFFFVFWGTEKIYEPVIGTVISEQIGEKAGLKSGDRIVAINQVPTESFAQVVEAISKNPEQEVQLMVEHIGGKNELIKITPSAEADPNPLKKGNKVGRIGVLPLVTTAAVRISPNSTAAAAGLQNFDQIVSFNGKKISRAEDLMAAIKSYPNEDWHLEIKRMSADKKLTDLNIVLKNEAHALSTQEAVLDRYAVNNDELVSKTIMQQIEQTRILLKQAALNSQAHRGITLADTTIEKVKEETPAAALGLQKGDQIISVNGKKIDGIYSLQKAFEAHPDDIQVMGVQTGKADAVLIFRLAAVKSSKNMDEPGQKEVGYELFMPFAEGPFFERHVGPVAAFTKSINKTGELIVMTLQSLWMLVSMQVSASQIGGPIAIFGVAGQAAEAGAAMYIFVMSLISVNLGLLNLLPIPVLDGGHLLMFGIEAVQRKPISIKTRTLVTQIGFFLLLALMAVAIFNDLSRVLG